MNKKVLTLLGSVALLLVIGTLSAAIVFAGHSRGSTTKGTVEAPTKPPNVKEVKGASATLKMNDAMQSGMSSSTMGHNNWVW